MTSQLFGKNKRLTQLKIGFWLLCGVLFTACGSTDERFANFDQQLWKNDPKGCKAERLSIQPQVANIQEYFIGMNDKELRSILGKPDFVDLFKRNQKFYIYYLEPGKQCQGNESNKIGRSYEIRFDALNFVNEVSLRYATATEE